MVQEGIYITLLREIIKRKYDPKKKVIEYTTDELRQYANELGINLGNPADFKYNLTRRKEDFPEDIKKMGFNTIQTVKRGVFILTWIDEKYVDLPDIEEIENISSDLIPDIVKQFLVKDEQSLLSIINYCNLIDEFFGEECYIILPHWRTTYSSIQVEIDSLFVYSKNNKLTLLPIEAKIHEKERFLTREQILSHLKAVSSKYPEFDVISVAAILLEDNTILLIAFKGNENLDDFEEIFSKRFRLDPPIWT